MQDNRSITKKIIMPWEIHQSPARQKAELYQKKIIQDVDFPVQMLVNRISSTNERRAVFYPHWHEHLELHYIVSGQMCIQLDQKEQVVQQGDLAIVNGNVLHSGYCTTSLEALVIIFEMDALARELADNKIVFKDIISMDTCVREIMQTIYNEFARREIGYCLVCKGKILELISYLTRNYAIAMLSGKESLKHMKKLEQLNIVKQYIGNNYGKPIKNRELADLLCLSEDRFIHLFKECMDISPLQYINNIRLEKAMHLLKSGQYMVKEVAEEVGFDDYNYFGRMFRRKFGVTPTQVKPEINI